MFTGLVRPTVLKATVNQFQKICNRLIPTSISSIQNIYQYPPFWLVSMLCFYPSISCLLTLLFLCNVMLQNITDAFPHHRYCITLDEFHSAHSPLFLILRR